MAIISNFELLLKPLAPRVGPGLEVARTVVQGYFLEISNLESRDITLIFRTKTSVRGATDSVNTELTSTNHILVYDITQDNNINGGQLTSAGALIANRQLGHYRSCIELPAGQTASLALLPNTQLLAGPQDVAIRGYAELVLSSTIDSFSPLTFSAPRSARILVSPEHRGTFIDPDFDPTDINIQRRLDFDQAAYSLPTANGQARQIINTHANFDDPFQDFLTSDFGGLVRRTSTSTLAELSRNLPKGANSPTRKAQFSIGSVPVEITYSIKNGKYVVEEKSLTKALKVMTRRRRITKDIPSTKDLAKQINAALSGNKKANKEISSLMKKLLK